LLVTIKIHSAFKDLFSDTEYRADIHKYCDLLYYLGSMHTKFKSYAKSIDNGLIYEGYAILDKNLKVIKDQELFYKTAKEDDIFYVTPAIVGGGGKTGRNLLKFAAIAAAVYVGYGAFTGTGIGGSLFGTSAAGAGGGASLMGTAADAQFMGAQAAGAASGGLSMGATIGLNVGLALVTSLFTQRDKPRETDQSIRSNDMFGSLQNTIDSGVPIPLIYGLHRVTGQLISGYLDTVDHGKDDVITVSSRFNS